MKSIVLVLSHRGQTYLSEWADALVAYGRRGFVLSSELRADTAAWLEDLRPEYVGHEIVSRISLTQEDVDRTLFRLQREGYEIEAVVTVWENYREIMANCNRRLGAPDLSGEQVHLLRDKLHVREALRSAGLSHVHGALLTPETLNANQRRKAFVKPRFGVASFGAFKLPPDFRWEAIEEIQRQMREDRDYRDYFTQDSSLIIEDYIPGQEFSFEVLVGGGESVVMAAHEKLELESVGRTTLETACISPPHQVSVVPTLAWMDQVLRTFNIQEGLFHIEARLHNGQWEIIEINPRMGGALILQSSLQVSGYSLLEGWLGILLRPNAWARRAVIKRLRHFSLGSEWQQQLKHRAFFRVYFAQGQKTVQSISIDNNQEAPLISKCFLKEGMKTPDSEREIFLAQALWRIPDSEGILRTILEQSKTYFSVKYA